MLEDNELFLSLLGYDEHSSDGDISSFYNDTTVEHWQSLMEVK